MYKRVDPTPNGMTPPHEGIGLMYMRWNDGERYRGTGVLVDNQHILTCAHNLVDKQQKGNGEANMIWFFPGWNSTEILDPGKSSRVIKGIYHHLYRMGQDAWDVGICRLENPVRVNSHHFFTPTEPDDYESEFDANLTGYPKDKAGEMWQDSCNIDNMEITTNTMLYGHTTYGGSSGSPIWQSIGDVTKQYGIHVSQEDEDIRRGVMITSAVKTWIRGALQYSDKLNENNLIFQF